MFFDATTNDHGLPFNPMKALIGPRPIGWISAVSQKGEVNLSPYSFFNAVGENPFIVAFSSSGYKDAVAFIDETHEFVCNFPHWEQREALNVTSLPLPRGQSEMDHAGLRSEPSHLIKPPRVAGVPAALECRHVETIQLKGADGKRADQYLVLGEIVGVFIEDRFILDGLVDTAAMHPITRGGYHDYFVGTPETRFTMRRPGL